MCFKSLSVLDLPNVPPFTRNPEPPYRFSSTFSITVTRIPSSASAMAAINPDSEAPITMAVCM